MPTSGPPAFDSLVAGTLLPDLVVTPELIDAVQYAAAMWEFQKLHFDPDWARAEGLDGPIAQGPLLGNYLARLVGGWAGPRGRLVRLSWRNRGVAVLGHSLTCSGRVTGTAPDSRPCMDGSPAGLVRCDLAITSAAGAPLLAGHAEVLLPRSSA